MIDYQDWDMAVAQNRRIFKTTDGNDIKHPAVFPIELPLRHIQTWTNEGDIVLDPFMGSGTTALAAIRLKRNFIGLELNKDYVDIANTLINEEKKIKKYD
jgi:site-specific DNA-methyltransferase (adenine-specific)